LLFAAPVGSVEWNNCEKGEKLVFLRRRKIKSRKIN
jgi:hypothetical protein